MMQDLSDIKEIEDDGYKWEYNSEMVCPYCGHNNITDFEYDDEDDRYHFVVE
jgi:hypothetical protein